MTLPREWSTRARAPHGKLLIRRHRPADTSHGLVVISPSYRNAIRSSSAVVVDIGLMAQGDPGPLHVGDHVLVAAGAGKELVFGYQRNDQDELWVVDVESILCRFKDIVELAKDEGEHYLKHQKELEAKLPTVDEKWTEGEREAPR